MGVNAKRRVQLRQLRAAANARTQGRTDHQYLIDQRQAAPAKLGGVASSASKFAVSAFSTAVAGEVAQEGVRVTSICPGEVDTADSREPSGRR